MNSQQVEIAVILLRRRLVPSNAVAQNPQSSAITYAQPVAILHTPSLGGTASFGGDIRGLGAVPPAGPGAKPLVRGSGGEVPPEAESFLFHNFFSEARADIKRF